MSRIPESKAFPFAPGEALTRSEAGAFVGRCPKTIDHYCRTHGVSRVFLGRRYVSRVALLMLVDNDYDALAAWRAGQLSSPEVVAYYTRAGIVLPEVSAE